MSFRGRLSPGRPLSFLASEPPSTVGSTPHLLQGWHLVSTTHFDRQSDRYLEGKAAFCHFAANSPDAARLLFRKLLADAEAAEAEGDVTAALASTEACKILWHAIESVTAEQLVKARHRRAANLAVFAATARSVNAKTTCAVRTRRATPRLREHRARRRVSRSTSSSSSDPGEPGEPPPPLGGFETCPSCGHVLVWANGQLMCPNRGCGRGRVAG